MQIFDKNAQPPAQHKREKCKTGGLLLQRVRIIKKENTNMITQTKRVLTKTYTKTAIFFLFLKESNLSRPYTTNPNSD